MKQQQQQQRRKDEDRWVMKRQQFEFIERPRPLIYIYDLPPEFTFHHYEVRPAFESVKQHMRMQAIGAAW